MDAAEEETPSENRFRFSTRSLLWATALLFSALVAFGWMAVPILALVLIYKSKQSSGVTLLELIVFTFVVAFVTAMLPLTEGVGRWRNHADENARLALADWAYAVRHYRVRAGFYPRDFESSESQRLSWRAIILPVVEGPDCMPEYGLSDGGVSVIDVSELEYGPVSATPMPTSNHFVAVVGEGTAWNQSMVWPDYHAYDYKCAALLMIEADCLGESGWPDPGDASVDQAIAILTREPGVPIDWHRVDKGWLYRRANAANIALVDGRVLTLYSRLSEATARALVLPVERLSETQRNELQAASKPPLDYRLLVGLPTFVAILLAPAWAMPRQRRPRPAA